MKRTNLLSALAALCAFVAFCPATNANEPSATDSFVFNEIARLCLEAKNAALNADFATASVVEKYAQDANGGADHQGELQKKLNEKVKDERAITWWVPKNVDKKNEQEPGGITGQPGPGDGIIGQPGPCDPVVWETDSVTFDCNCYCDEDCCFSCRRFGWRLFGRICR